MLIGLEYVIAAYVIWLSTFVIYILLTKRRLKIVNSSVAALQERKSKIDDNSVNV